MSKKDLNFDKAFSDLENLSEEEKQKEKDIDENNEETETTTEDKPQKDKKEENKTDNNKNIKENDPWKENEKTQYRTTITIDSETEENYLSCKRRFRKQLKTRLTKQAAVELGMMLLNNLDSEIIEYIKDNFTPEDDIVEEIKNIIRDN